ncbi:DNA-binding transcription factor yap1 [Onygenales sp. PD_40]|nr:DNA-binding transcription factor yap1 [Onygenales sp. PD_40]KAK2781075.1 DNA-binding transcription factor yap1 [Emmonsiellopsis sp. PD_33]
MSNFDSIYQRSLYLSPDQQDLLLAALSSADPTARVPKEESSKTTSPQISSLHNIDTSEMFESPQEDAPGSGQLGFEASPFLDYFDADFDPNGVEDLIGDLPGTSSAGDEPEAGEKRKSIDGKEDEQNGKKRRETDDKLAKKPGRKPLMSEPTSKRKAQNRAAQRAFRERKEKHLKDLETKVEELEKVSESTNNENKILRSQVEKLQVELREYRKRLSWMNSGTGTSPLASLGARASEPKHNYRYNNNSNDFSFEFPKFGDLPSSHLFRNSPKTDSNQARSPTGGADYRVAGAGNRNSSNGSSQPTQFGVNKDSQPPTTNNRSNSTGSRGQNSHSASLDTLNGYYGALTGPRHNGSSSYSASGSSAGTNSNYSATENGQTQNYISSNVSNSDSPSSYSESQPCHISSIGTSPEPGLNSPSMGKQNEYGLNTINEENSGRNATEGEETFCKKLGSACGCAENPIPAALSHSNDRLQSPDKNDNNNNLGEDGLLGFDWLAQQNGGNFDPILFADYRDPQEAVLGQEFGSFFNEAFPLPDLDSPLHAFAEPNSTAAPKNDLIQQIDHNLEANDEEVVPAVDRSQMMSCTKIWDRLQSMEKFRNGEIDVDNLCSELRTKARCSEVGVVVDQNDVEDIMSRAK